MTAHAVACLEFKGGVKGETVVMVRTEGHCKLYGSATLQWSERM